MFYIEKIVFEILSFLIDSDPKKFFDHAKKHIEYLKKQIGVSSTTTITNEQNNPYRIQIAELCRDIIEQKELQLNQEDERLYRLLSVEMLSILKTVPANLNEFVS